MCYTIQGNVENRSDVGHRDWMSQRRITIRGFFMMSNYKNNNLYQVDTA